MRPSLFSYSLPELRDYFVSQGLAKFAADQVYNWIFKKYNWNLDTWSNVGAKVKNHIKEQMDISLPKIIWDGLSEDGTRKFLLQMNDKQSVESVVIPAKNNRLTLCVSTQVGCAIGCTFCHTGTMGLKRHLSINEIVGQYMAIGRWLLNETGEDVRITNIVYMGQGEPLHNFENTKNATIIFMEDQGLGLGQRKITLSTSGLVPQIEKLADFPPVNIAISLHASRDDVRTELMPINKVYDLKRLFTAIRKIPLKAHRHITYEYLLIKDLNDGQEDIEGLSRLLPKKVSKINIIPFNEYPGSNFKRPPDERVIWFQKSLLDRGLITTIRATKGQDILAACGQLKSELEQPNLWN
ncbi:MAG: 23S rRNA (adenine(2503)-C(2))-methyltransferase RlmN [Epsilonproteobacteria bacterium]|nr:MAG: 23S rRNA (adenine(2503)-C(2))-methyltransferase RlmN [Campylobacterota bacterium]RLA64889.1 MAG: 23S rRNA (adenine(2503)-C(2))-methyltransferase RlmN [Campylobacterota bacterium]